LAKDIEEAKTLTWKTPVVEVVAKGAMILHSFSEPDMGRDL
jgi:hypothetical protein